jgi:hypothetical protein
VGPPNLKDDDCDILSQARAKNLGENCYTYSPPIPRDSQGVFLNTSLELTGTPLSGCASVHPGNDALCRPRVLCVGWSERLLKDGLLDVDPIADRD